MVDAPNSIDPPPIPGATPPEGPAGFLATTSGRLVVGGIALVVVLGIIGAIVYVFLLSPSTPSAPSSGGAIVQHSAAGGGAQAGSAVASEQPAPIVDPLEKPLESTFTFRNVFAPTLKESMPVAIETSITSLINNPPKKSSSTSSSTTSSGTPNVPANTLFLESIQTVNGKTTATFIWNGATYVLGEGETIPNTPWKVISIGTNSVLMVFGDSEVTLTTGQGLTK